MRSLEPSMDARLATRLRRLRSAAGWSLDGLAQTSNVSRATLSRLENGEVSPTASVLNKLCAAYGMTMSRLMVLVEGEEQARVPLATQEVWTDPQTGFRRRSVSPPSAHHAGEVIEGALPAAATIAYEATPRAGLEHHLVLLEGGLSLTVDGTRHELEAGDCLRYRLFGPSRFETGPGEGARYLLFMV